MFFTNFCRDSRQQYHFMHKCNSMLNTPSSIANQTVSLALTMRFYKEFSHCFCEKLLYLEARVINKSEEIRFSLILPGIWFKQLEVRKSSPACVLSKSKVNLEHIKSCKLLGVHINEHLKWDDHIKDTVSGCYTTLSTLRKLNYLAKYELRKQLAETLILSKLNYADLVFYPLPQFLLHHLQRVQFTVASLVLGHYVKNFRDILKIGWLPINERRDLNLLKSCFKALHNAET